MQYMLLLKDSRHVDSGDFLKSIMYYSYYFNFQVKASGTSVEKVRRTDTCQVAEW